MIRRAEINSSSSKSNTGAVVVGRQRASRRSVIFDHLNVDILIVWIIKFSFVTLDRCVFT